MRMSAFFMVAVLILGACAVGNAIAAPAQKSPEMTDFQKEAAEAIRAITLQLILLAVGVFSLAGAYLVKKENGSSIPLVGREWLLFGFILLGVSVAFGYIVHNALIFQLIQAGFDPNAPALRSPSVWQALTFLAGGVLFMIFVFVNIR